VSHPLTGIILAGGTGSRLFPLTKVTNKHLLPVGRHPMIYHPVGKLVQAGIRDIVVVTGPDDVGALAAQLGSGRGWGVRFTYRVQDEPGGVADALASARDCAGPAGVAVLLGDNIFEDSLRPTADRFLAQGGGARVLIKEVPDPERYGVAVLDRDRIVHIEEKPRAPASRLCVTGVYFYDPEVFQILRQLRPSARGELEITDVNNDYARRGRIAHDVLAGWWVDAGTFASLARAADLAARLPADALPVPVPSEEAVTP